jgi:phage shock protein A
MNMSETLTNRVGRIIAGSFHALIDAVEDAAPESVMEQAIREIDAAVTDVRADLGVVEAQRHLTAKRLSEDSARHESLSENARLGLEQGREDLAAAAVERQLDIEAQIPVLESRLADLAEDKARLEGYVTALLAKKREMQDALSDYRRSREKPTVAPEGSAANGGTAQVRADRATEAFDRIFQRQTGLKGMAGTVDKTAAQLAELEELARQNRIRERLAQLKASS